MPLAASVRNNLDPTAGSAIFDLRSAADHLTTTRLLSADVLPAHSVDVCGEIFRRIRAAL